jgi:hypothetical protein
MLSSIPLTAFESALGVVVSNFNPFHTSGILSLIWKNLRVIISCSQLTYISI